MPPQAEKKVDSDKPTQNKPAANSPPPGNKVKVAATDEKKQTPQPKRDEENQSAEKKRRDDQDTQKLHDDQINRFLGQLGASGGPQATGTAQQSSGPSAAYGGRVAARIKPNVVFTDTVNGNPRAEVEVRTLPDGTITTRRIVKSSGSPAWDEAVLRAIDRTGTLPRDTDGRVPASLIIGLRPQD
jgi:colicin import membrane protein